MAGEESQIDQFKLLNCLAAGQHSEVWDVTDTLTPRRVAMKLLKPDAAQDRDVVNVLKRECKIGSSFEHPYILKYYETVIGKEHRYFIMELFRGTSLKAFMYNDLAAVHVRFKRIVESVAMALEHVHQKGWVHKDIKPENILVTKGSEVRLIDFSLTDACSQGFLSKLFQGKKVIQGTRTYMAPEQIQGKPSSFSMDIYALGITMFEMLAGAPPFRGSSPNDLLLRHLNELPGPPSGVNKNVTPEMDRIVARLLEKKPEKRYKSITEFLLEFRAVEPFKEPVQEKTGKETAVEAGAVSEESRLNSRADAARTASGKGKTTTADEKPAASPKPATVPAATSAAKPPPHSPAPHSPALSPTPAAPAPAGMPAPRLPATHTVAAANPAAPKPPARKEQGGGPALPVPPAVPQYPPGYQLPPGVPYPPGISQPAYPQPGYPPAGYPGPAYPQPGYPPTYPPVGYPPQGYPQPGYPQAPVMNPAAPNYPPYPGQPPVYRPAPAAGGQPPSPPTVPRPPDPANALNAPNAPVKLPAAPASNRGRLPTPPPQPPPAPQEDDLPFMEELPDVS